MMNESNVCVFTNRELQVNPIFSDKERARRLKRVLRKQKNSKALKTILKVIRGERCF